MPNWLKAGLIYALKNAVNAALTAAGPVGLWPTFFNVHTLQGLEHVLGIVGSAVLARELMVWGPKILKWSTTDSIPPDPPAEEKKP